MSSSETSETKDSVGELSDKTSGDIAAAQLRKSSTRGSATSLARGLSGPVARSAEFLRDVRSETKRVSWPSAMMVRNTTIITLIAVVFFGLYLYGVDHILAFLVQQIDRFAGWLLGAA
ncbi:MAG: preprotein translocase subunit SecE [Pyrinomonadaceae bacterium]